MDKEEARYKVIVSYPEYDYPTVILTGIKPNLVSPYLFRVLKLNGDEVLIPLFNVSAIRIEEVT